MEGKTPASPVVGSRVQSQQVLGNEERMKGSQIGAEEKKPGLEITAKFFEKLYSSKVIQADPLKNAVGVTCCTPNFIHSPPSPLVYPDTFSGFGRCTAQSSIACAHTNLICAGTFSILLVIAGGAKATQALIYPLALFA